MMRDIRPADRLTLFVASLMRTTNDLDRRLRSSGYSRQEIDEVKEWARENTLLRGRLVPRATFHELFGPPLQEDETRMVYQLRMWPQHYFDLGFTPNAGVFYQGFRLKSPAPKEPATVETTDAPNRLEVGWHTWREVNLLLGPPDLTRGWDLMEDWFYGPTEDDRCLTLSLDCGLLTDVFRGPCEGTPSRGA
jgi:hypothetical protein